MTDAPTRIKVHAAAPYDVVIGYGLFEAITALVGDARQVAVIHPEGLSSMGTGLRETLAGHGFEAHAVVVPTGEAAKTADVANFCWNVLGRAGFTRTDVIVGLGGGATTDLAGFVAATWLRGVRLVQVPTSLLGMVDAAVGGKTGINTDEGKNLVGAFHEPSGVVCDVDLLRDLPRAELVSGLAEVIKCGFIADPAILEIVESGPDVALDAAGEPLRELIVRSISVKAAVVSDDLRETGGADGVGRAALNYGHTFGHAVERVEKFGFRHGAAVAIGMRYVAELARLAGRLDPATAERHRRVLELVGLPTSYAPGRWSELYEAMRIDKKARGDQLRFVVLDGLARPAILEGPDPALLTAAYAEIVR
jgi:3-dehydroquinate synthase